MSAKAESRASPKYSLSSENTRSAAAELGVNEKTIRAASAHVGNLVPWVAHQPSTFSVNAFVSRCEDSCC